MWPTAEQRASSKTSTPKPKPTPKKPTSFSKSPTGTAISKYPSTNKPSPSLPLPLRPQPRTYRGPATLGNRKVRSSPTFQRLIVDGQSYVLVPEHEHHRNPEDAAKANSLIERLREIRNDLFEDGSPTFNLAGKQIGIAIEVLREEFAAEMKVDQESDEVF